MKLLLNSLHLASLCALSSYSVFSRLVVTQSEDVTLEEGETAQISCCWSDVSKRDRTRVIWTKKQNRVHHEVLQSSCSHLNISNITKEHSGKYVCEVLVEIPIVNHGSGNGTVITVLSKNEILKEKEQKEDSDGSRFWLLVGLAVAAPVLLITVICFCCLRRKRAGQAARVIYEAPHFDSETQDMDKTSTGSSGSSQWCQVPVYESVDYFEQVEAKKSG